MTGIPIIVEGEDQKSTAILVLVAGLLFFGIGGIAAFFIKGKNAELRTGTTANTSVAADVIVEIDSKP